jgi:hypothetical protein
MAKNARSKMGMMTSPARSARLGATEVDPGDLMSQASGYRVPPNRSSGNINPGSSRTDGHTGNGDDHHRGGNGNGNGGNDRLPYEGGHHNNHPGGGSPQW